MTLFRSLAFQVLFYANLVGQLLLYLPVFFFLPEATRWRIVKRWAQSSLWLLRMVAGTRSAITGQGNLPSGPLIVAAKHQSFWEVIAILPEVEKPTFILKKELMRIPVFGWYARRMGMIPVDRRKRGAVLPSLLAGAERAVREGRQIVIFPEGTRSAPGAAPNYRPGIHFLYEKLRIPVAPMALNSGLFWPRQAVRRQPGTIRAEFLEPIAPGLEREAFVALLRERVEARSLALMRQAYVEHPDLPMSELVAVHLGRAPA
ncbi:lysophospholipid acyltransferase family protein [Aureimonas jatrophae]|uniref:1-acyl-sn-glycerol-3-phosphate acyltransferase n=1 Tax=Aureimonas jatrophae TaxID=1166073 RepID=A0A1H0IBX3_9HYPH|nr:lysophospholipid acyltransferase family protein [Aureimonas jatrophae]MBB3952086.1 1-acyl-sn-glycerol-3-phosphate acyltransferase [Aureimonas jatrophae]SDO28908.1 1-acyl-sn-glycerol-3-phosphate acyltransferase [Aureimonas jatrophae]